jgi:hypothetical protein
VAFSARLGDLAVASTQILLFLEKVFSAAEKKHLVAALLALCSK